MTTVDDLVTWLRAQLDADERVAKRALSFRYDHPLDAPWENARIAVERKTASSWERYAARLTPARALAEVEAKRAIIADLGKANDAGESVLWSRSEVSTIWALERAVQHLASAYADRAGWREEWRPT
jgi:hypothetical protein